MKAARLFLATLVLAIPQAAIACQCCGEDDTSFEDEIAPDSYYAGDFRFKLRRTPQYRIRDITFFTKPDADPSEMNNTYHEVQLDGVLTLPTLLAKKLGRDSIDATILLQGVDGSCFGAGVLQRWLFRAEDDRDIWLGSGELIQPAP